MLVILCLAAFVLIVSVLINTPNQTRIMRYVHRLAIWGAACLIAAAMFYAGLSLKLTLCVLLFTGLILTLFVSLAEPASERQLPY